MKTIEPKIKNVTLSLYIKRNTRTIVRNWKQEHIRKQFDYSICKYIKAKVLRMSDIFQIPENHATLQAWAGKMYRTL